MDQLRGAPYIAAHDTSAKPSAPDPLPVLSSLGGWRALLANPGLILHTLWRGRCVGIDAGGNRYFEENRPSRPDGRKRRWVVYAKQARDASLVPPEWHAWLHFITDAPLPASERRPWQAPYMPNPTGTAHAYRPPGHDYRGAAPRRAASYEAWTPGE